jgi:hypothetical protein
VRRSSIGSSSKSPSNFLLGAIVRVEAGSRKEVKDDLIRVNDFRGITGTIGPTRGLVF